MRDIINERTMTTRMDRIYQTTYAHDRRKHRHRCQCCARIINAGENVVMWKLGKKTRALHLECSEVIAIENVTHRQLAELHLRDMYGN